MLDDDARRTSGAGCFTKFSALATLQTRSWRQFRAGLIATDALAIVIAYILADMVRCGFYMRTPWPELLPTGDSSVRMHMKVLVFLPFVWPMILQRLDWYSRRWQTWTSSIKSAAIASILLSLFVSAIALLIDRDLYPRMQIALLAVIAPATSLAARGITAVVALRLGGRRRRRVLIVGTGRDAVRLRRLASSSLIGRPHILGHLRPPWETEAAAPSVVELGGMDRLASAIDEDFVDEVLFSAPLERLAELLPYVRQCEEVGVPAGIQAESIACHSLPEITDLHGLPMLAYAAARHSPEALAVKRALDIAVAVVGIVLTGPIMLLCAGVIRLTTGSPILFHQLRSGLNGRTFVMYKFRTMEDGAERKQAEIAHLNESDGPVFKVSNDPRITRIGRFLRRWSFDELPQLFNVLKGDMSVVGPRPPIPAEVAQYDRWQRRRLSMRPGLTCLWQIKGRHRIGFEEWMRLDLYYIDHWSLTLDFLIFCRTIPTVLGGTGA